MQLPSLFSEGFLLERHQQLGSFWEKQQDRTRVWYNVHEDGGDEDEEGQEGERRPRIVVPQAFSVQAQAVDGRHDSDGPAYRGGNWAAKSVNKRCVGIREENALLSCTRGSWRLTMVEMRWCVRMMKIHPPQTNAVIYSKRPARYRAVDSLIGETTIGR